MGRIWQGPRPAPPGPARRSTPGVRRGLLLAAATAVACAVPACSPGAPAGTAPAGTGPASHRPHPHNAAPKLHVSGNRLVTAHGRPVVLRGVNRSGTEFMCVHGHGIFDGPHDQASVSAMKAWRINAVRIPMNEACWLGDPYVNPAYAGANYQSAIEAYVSLLNANGMVAILDLHWTGGAYTGPTSQCASPQAVCLKPMPDAAQAISFWTSVAKAFKGNGAVIFDLFNEPYPGRAAGNEAEGWQCWLNGGSCPGIHYPVAGMQTLVNAVRGTGARNVILLGGLAYANDLTGWLAHEPSDPDHNLAASWHSYSFNRCSNPACWTSEVAPVIAQVPLVAGEIGETDCTSRYITELMNWLDSESSGYLAWAWNADFSCAAGPSLITGYAGTPTPYGAGLRSHLRSLGP